MASEIRVNKIENRSGLGTVTFADTGVDLAGIVTATTFSGSGASLTNLPAANITGTLPAIDGSNLTGVASTENIRTNTNATFLQNINVSGTSTVAGTSTANLFSGSGASLTSIPAANIVGVATAGFARSGGFGGITEVDIWRMTSNIGGSQGSESLITNWERSDDSTVTYIGTGMSHNSGIFSFPSTGKWLIQVAAVMYGVYAFQYGEIFTRVTTDDFSSDDAVASSISGVGNNGGYDGAYSSALIDVTETTNTKVKFTQQTASSSQRFVAGNTSANYTHIVFIRIGDT